MKKAFDAVAWMRAQRERLDTEYAGLSAQEIRRRIQESMKDDPLWKRLQGHALRRDRMTVHEPEGPHRV